MPVPLSEIRAALLPGLFDIRGEYISAMWAREFAAPVVEILPAITLGPSAVVAMATAAVVIKNPTVSRRGIFSWFGRG